jgi:hypothetical protein
MSKPVKERPKPLFDSSEGLLAGAGEALFKFALVASVLFFSLFGCWNHWLRGEVVAWHQLLGGDRSGVHATDDVREAVLIVKNRRPWTP